ncbi:MAG: hypothetical protein FJY20_08820 [Bacteroidetes bacterium]|nr:hypothetical protein [Bacteroidota bacterium]
MRIVQVVSKPECDNFLSLVKKKKRELRQRKRGTFYHVKPNRWKHVSYSGYIDFHKAHKNISIFEIKTRASDGNDWQLLHSFLGFLDRHFHDTMESVTILYRD